MTCVGHDQYNLCNINKYQNIKLYTKGDVLDNIYKTYLKTVGLNKPATLKGIMWFGNPLGAGCDPKNCISREGREHL